MLLTISTCKRTRRTLFSFLSISNSACDFATLFNGSSVPSQPYFSFFSVFSPPFFQLVAHLLSNALYSLPSDLTSENPSIAASTPLSSAKIKTMPISRAVERNAQSLPSSPQKTYTLSSHLPTQYEELNGEASTSERISHRRPSDVARKATVSTRTSPPSSTTVASHSQSSRRSTKVDPSKARRPSNSDTQSGIASSNGLKQQQLAMGNSDSDRSVARASSPQPAPSKLKCTLPTTPAPPGYVRPSKLFNMMGYGLDNQYLFMHAHYLYIIDCRRRDQFNESHIITGNSITLLSPNTLSKNEYKRDRGMFLRQKKVTFTLLHSD